MIYKANKDWLPLRSSLAIRPGSALDWSQQGLHDGPAGKYGWLRNSRKNPGRFEFERRPGKTVRFYATNLCFSSQFVTHKESDLLADRLMRLGYNSVRFHHYETVGTGNNSGLVDSDAPDSLSFHPGKLDQFDYLFAALKKRGLYLTTDLYVNRAVKAWEIFPGEEGNVAYRFKTLVQVSERALANWKEFSRVLLLHVNPYTGLAYRDDPALPLISMINEGNVTNYLNEIKTDRLLRPVWEEAFHAWLKQRRQPRPKGDFAKAVDSPLFKLFVYENHGKTQRRQLEFLRKELGVKAMLTDLNGWFEHCGTQALRADYDYVDNHFYWDHPSFLEGTWGLPSRGWSGGGSSIARGGEALWKGVTRLLDRPFTVTEFNYTAPNAFTGEAGLMLGAYAALQDWGGLWRFCYSHDKKRNLKPDPVNYFDTVSDPVRQASEYAAVALYLRGDAAPARHTLAVTGSKAEYWKEAGEWLGSDLAWLSLCVKFGSVIGKSAGKGALSVPLSKRKEKLQPFLDSLRKKGLLKKENRTDLEAGIFESETGETRVETKAGVLTVNTPRTVGIAGPEGTSRRAGPLTVWFDRSWGAVWASSMDKQPLERSRRILLVHLTDIKNTGMKFRDGDKEKDVLEAWGKLPWLIRAGEVSLRLEHRRAKTLKVWRLDMTGKRLGRVALDAPAAEGVVEFKARTQSKSGPTLYYEITT